MTIKIKDKKKKVLFDSKFIRVIIENNFTYVQEPWCNNQGVAILPYVFKDNQYHFLQIHNENNPTQKKSKASQYSTITGGLENKQFYTTVVNEMLEETGIDISENVTIDRLDSFAFANKSSDKKWYLYAIDLTNLNLDINQTYYGKGGDGTDFEKGIHANFVNSYILAGGNDVLSTSIWGRFDLVKKYKENENQNFLKKLEEKINEININQIIDLRLLFDKTFLNDESYVDVELGINHTTVIPKAFPLHYAVDNAYFEIAKLLLEKGANPNIKYIGSTPLQIAIANFNNNIEIVKLLIEKGADVNIQNDNGDSLLDIAVKNDKIEVVKLLLNHSNIDVNIKNDYIKSILFYSAKNGHINSLKLLIEKGADVNIQNDNGDTPLHIALKNDKIEVVKLLLNHSNIDVNIKNDNGFTPLHFAVDNAYFEIAKLLLEKGADVNIQNDNGDTPLHWAVKNNDFKMVQLLIDNNADVNIKNIYGDTPLHWAVKNSYFKMVRLLIDNNADVNAQDNKGFTPLHWAVKKSDFEISEFLFQNVTYGNKNYKRKCSEISTFSSKKIKLINEFEHNQPLKSWYKPSSPQI